MARLVITSPTWVLADEDEVVLGAAVELVELLAAAVVAGGSLKGFGEEGGKSTK